VDGVPEGSSVFEDLFRPGLDGRELAVKVVKLWVTGLWIEDGNQNQ
jgi:hypothetical protein